MRRSPFRGNVTVVRSFSYQRYLRNRRTEIRTTPAVVAAAAAGFACAHSVCDCTSKRHVTAPIQQRPNKEPKLGVRKLIPRTSAAASIGRLLVLLLCAGITSTSREKVFSRDDRQASPKTGKT